MRNVRILALIPSLSLLGVPFTAHAGSPTTPAMPGVEMGARPMSGHSGEAFTDGQKAFDDTMKVLLEQYVDDKVTSEDLYRGAVQGMLEHAGGRSWDTLLSPSAMGDIGGALAGEIVGIGVAVKFDGESGMTLVKDVLPGSAAEKAQILAGDQILKIDGKSFKGMDTPDVVAAIRGHEGEPVTLTILRDDKVISKTVRREKITVQSVTDSVLPGDVGLLAISSFNEKTPELVKDALNRFAKRKIHSLIIDLRNDQGGLFDKALEVADMLIPKGRSVVTLVHRGGTEEVIVSKGTPILAVPIAVLVNEATASGAEILAGALKESADAKIVGRKTFGKWNVQRLEALPNKFAIKYTIGVFKTPNGELLDGIGLVPDLEVEMDKDQVEKTRRLDGRERLAQDAQLRVAAASLKP